ncbi:hypothetical protein GBF35_19925 [Nonomuraea phyllanthi]|uniref:hypothetical protein n=1 Tax=Nonomuraea phyllanthi TaxID=2219224 RepID=UPI001293F1FD|nr:hypothetical protein GBF35_19925 [Nonomuraea phyllanthi]
MVGGPGSGKTTLASALATALVLPHHDLDRRGLCLADRRVRCTVLAVGAGF